MIAILHGALAYGAVERYVAAIAEGLGGREEVVLLHPDHPALEPFAELGVETLPYPPRLLDSAPRLLAHLVSCLRRLRPRVVHVADVWPVAQVAARLAGVPRILVTHHTPGLPRRDNLAGRVWWTLGWLARPEVVYTSETDRRSDARRRRTHVVPLGVELERFRDARPVLVENGPVIGNVARLAAQKGHAYLLEAAPRVLARYPEARFVIVGDGALRGDLEARAREAGIADRVLFTGERADVPSLLASFDVFAFPSLFEGLCLAVIEAQAVGVPVVATAVGGIQETVVPGVTGLLCAPADPVGLAEGILRVLDRPEEARKMAEEARRRALERFGVERMVEETVALYGSDR